MVVFVCLLFTLRFKTIWKRENEVRNALLVLPLPFIGVSILTTADGLTSSFSAATGARKLHGFPSGWLGTVGTGIQVHFGRRRITQGLMRT